MNLVNSGSSLDWTSSKLDLTRIQVQGRRCSVDDLTRLLARVKATFGPGPGPRVPVGSSPLEELNSGDEASSSSSSSPSREPFSSDSLFSKGHRKPFLFRNRKSLPDRLTDDHVTTPRQEARKRSAGRRLGVKFADDFGLNLNTFVMIPSRHSAHAQPEVAAAGRKSMFLLRELEQDCDEEDRLIFRLDGNPTDEIRKIRGRGSESPTTTRTQNPGFLSSTKTILRGNPEADPTTTMTSQPETTDFRLCFAQPFADLDNFRRKLRENFLCLENVRVDDRNSKECNNNSNNNNSTTPKFKDDETGSEKHPRPNRGTTILCSIKVRSSVRPSTVFARCTDNDWARYADLPAQRLHGVNNLGLDYVTFCFAVRKPVHLPGSEGAPRDGEGADPPSGPTSAVEFAVCAVVLTPCGSSTNYWDNNGGVNYRIEWFD